MMWYRLLVRFIITEWFFTSPFWQTIQKTPACVFTDERMLEPSQQSENKSRKSSALLHANQNITSVKTIEIYVRSSMTLGSHSAKCLTPAAVLIRLLRRRSAGFGAFRLSSKNKFFMELLPPQICSPSTAHTSSTQFQTDMETKTPFPFSLVYIWDIFYLFIYLFWCCLTSKIPKHETKCSARFSNNAVSTKHFLWSRGNSSGSADYRTMLVLKMKTAVVAKQWNQWNSSSSGPHLS